MRFRSSHYPNAPYFYQMCDRYGFLVCDEADIEAHGPFMLYRKEDTDYNRFKKWNEKIADDPAWEQAILDRVKRMVARDKTASVSFSGRWEMRVRMDAILKRLLRGQRNTIRPVSRSMRVRGIGITM
mgnify:CR=1 FL=1